MTPPLPEPGPDRGSTLIELVIAIALMGMVVAGVLGAMATSVSMSRMSDDQAKVEAVLGNAADRLTGYAYIPCPSGGQAGFGGYLPIVQAAAGAVGWPTSTVSISDIRYWSPGASAATGTWVASNGLTGNECNEAASLTTSRTLQKVTITVSSPEGLVRSLEVVKSNVFPRQQ